MAEPLSIEDVRAWAKTIEECGPAWVASGDDRTEAIAFSQRVVATIERYESELEIAEQRVEFLRTQVTDLCAAIDATANRSRTNESEG